MSWSTRFFTLVPCIALFPSVARAAAPLIYPGGVANAASYTTPLAPGSLFSIFGDNLAGGLAAPSSSTLPVTLGGVRVTVNGTAAPLVFVSPGQINAQVPWEAAGAAGLSMVVTYNGASSNSAGVPVAAAAPACFVMNASGQGAILFNGTDVIAAPDGSIPGRTSRPAAPGDYLSIFCTGLGSVTNPPLTGAPGLVSPLSYTVAATTVIVGNVPARVTFSGLAPGFPGLYQINIQVPDMAPVGNAVPISVSVGSATANTIAAAVSGTGIVWRDSFAITSLSSAAVLPMTPLTISATGLDPTAKVTVLYSNAAGFSATMQPLAVNAGSVVAPVPLYCDPTTGQIAGGAVSVALLQAGRTTAPASLAISDLPPLSAYGAKLGEISDAMLIFNSLLAGQRLNQLQAYASLAGARMDTSQARATLSTILDATNRARIDVSRVSADNSVVIPAGQLSDGTPIQFDRVTLDLMDRVNGLFLSQTFATVALPGASSPAARPDGLSPRITSDQFQLLLEALKEATGANDMAAAAIKSVDLNNDWLQSVEAIASASKVYWDMVPGARSSLFGPAAALVSVSTAAGNALGNLAAFLQGVVFQDQGLVDVAVQSMRESTGESVKAVVGLGLTLTGTVPVLAVASTVASYAWSLVQLGATSAETVQSYTNIQETTLQVAQDLQVLPSGSIATATGVAGAPAETAVTSPQAGLDLCCFGSIVPSLTTVTDPSGAFVVFVPTQVPGVDYGNLTLRVTSLITTSPGGTTVVDLRNLDPLNPLQLPPLSPTYGGTYQYSGTYQLTIVFLSPNTSGCTPNPLPQTWTVRGGKVWLLTSAPVESVGSFSGVLWAFMSSETVSFPAQTCGLFTDPPFSFESVWPGFLAISPGTSAPWTSSGTGDGRKFSIPLQYDMGTALNPPPMTGTISGTGSSVTLALEFKNSSTTAFSGDPVTTAFSATLFKQ